MSVSDRIERLRRALSGPLPGSSAYREATPDGYERETMIDGTPVTSAAVLLALHPDQEGERILFPLIRRPDSMLQHAGQIALPGGARDETEDAIACALREASEEIGLARKDVEVIGKLTPVTIPVSRYRVDTVVGWIRAQPLLRRQESEVLAILFADPDRLAREGPTTWVERVREGESLWFPAYSVQGEKVWGATALILAEFLAIWRQTFPSDAPHA